MAASVTQLKGHALNCTHIHAKLARPHVAWRWWTTRSLSTCCCLARVAPVRREAVWARMGTALATVASPLHVLTASTGARHCPKVRPDAVRRCWGRTVRVSIFGCCSGCSTHPLQVVKLPPFKHQATADAYSAGVSVSGGARLHDTA